MNSVVMFENLQGEDKINLDLPFVKRDLVLCIVHDSVLDKFLVLDWTNGWKSFLGGGIENDESVEAAGRREILEESGYVNLEFKKMILNNVEYKAFLKHKNQNRWARVVCVEFELIDLEREEILDEESSRFECLWISRENVLDFLNIVEHKYAWSEYLGLSWNQKSGELVDGVKLTHLDKSEF